MSLSYGYRNRPRKQRNQDPRDPSERSIQYALVDRLRICAPPHVLWFCVPQGELRDLSVLAGEERRSAFKLRSMGVRNGVADLCFVYDGRVLFLELKRRGKKPSPDQIDFARDAECAGAEYAYCDSIDDAVTLLTERGILPPDRRVR